MAQENLITSSSQIKENKGKTVITPNGVTFKVINWLTASEHKLDKDGSKYGSRLEIIQDGKQRIFFNAPPKGYECLTNFYNECGLKTDGTSSRNKNKKFEVKHLDLASPEQLANLQAEINKISQPTFACVWEQLQGLAKNAPIKELEEAAKFLTDLAKQKKAEAKKAEEDEIKALEARLKELKTKRK